MNFSRETDLPFTLEEHVEMSAVLDQQLIFAFSDIIRRLDFSSVEIANPIEADEKGQERINACSNIKLHYQLLLIT